jgi:hypothetical protein
LAAAKAAFVGTSTTKTFIYLCSTAENGNTDALLTAANTTASASAVTKTFAAMFSIVALLL